MSGSYINAYKFLFMNRLWSGESPKSCQFRSQLGVKAFYLILDFSKPDYFQQTSVALGALITA